MGVAEVVVGSLMFDFNFDLMARVLKVSSEKMPDKIVQLLHDYMTTMTRHWGKTPDRDAVVKIYLQKCEAALEAKSSRARRPRKN
jgi:lipoate---protein ligase